VTGLSLLEECYRDKLSDLLRHQAGARLIAQYDVNNTYQYIINREETQLSWLARAIAEGGGSAPDAIAEPERTGDAQSVLEQDSRAAQAFVDRWRARLGALTDARHRGTVSVIVGEALEHKRFFDQALAGQFDLLGRRTDTVGPRVGAVLPTRWIE
jgi:hypothetical protein